MEKNNEEITEELVQFRERGTSLILVSLQFQDLE